MGFTTVGMHQQASQDEHLFYQVFTRQDHIDDEPQNRQRIHQKRLLNI
jgi:hypothetical protein